MGFNVYSRGRAKTKSEAERAGKHIIRLLLSLDEKEGRVCYRYVTDFSVVDRIIDQLKLTFVTDRPPPPQIACQEVLMTAETAGEHFS